MVSATGPRLLARRSASALARVPLRGPAARVAPLSASSLPSARRSPRSPAWAIKHAALLQPRHCSTVPGTRHGHDPTDYRLPTNVAPTHYALTVWTDLVASKFGASLDVKEETDTIVLNTAKSVLGDVALRLDGAAAAQAATAREYDAKTQRATFTFAAPLRKGAKARLSVAFANELDASLMGYYRSTGGADGRTVYALTQFEPTSAREAFPCWDEPLLKATVAVTLVARVGTTSLSNMPAVSEAPFPDAAVEEPWIAEKVMSLADPSEWKVTKFATTPPISTYIIAYANGPFEYLEDSYTSPLSGKVRPLRIYATADNIGQAQFALDIKRKVLPLYEQVFDIEYPLPKLDTLVASDFDSGAMENWGLIAGRTSAYLVDPKSSDLRSRWSIATTQSHEVAHMWWVKPPASQEIHHSYLECRFGNITTMKWVFPEWQLDSEFLTTNFFDARGLDSKLSSHPVEVPCPDASLINQIFDALSYAKAASVLRMLCSYVGEEHFLKGVSIYLKKHKYSNSVTENLWEGIQEATGTWDDIGYPVVTVTEKEGGIHVRQDRFLETGPADPKDNETIWTIPLSLVTVGADGKATINRDLILDQRELFIPLDASLPFKLNADTTGFFATAYSEERLAKLGEQAAAENSPFSLSDRIGLVYDALALAKAGYSSVTGALDLIVGLKNEKNHLVWTAIATNLSGMVSTWWEDQSVVDQMNALRRELFVPIVKELGFKYSEQDSYNVTKKRTEAIGQAAVAGDPWVVGELKSMFEKFIAGDDSALPGDLLPIAFQIGVKEGGQAEWAAVKAIANAPKSPSQGLAAMRSMGASKNLAIAAETFRFILDGARDQDSFYYASGLSRNFTTRRWVVEKFKENYDELYRRNSGTFGHIRWIQILFGPLSSHGDADAINAFFEGKDTSKFDMALKQSIDTIKSRATWVARSTDELKGWLKKRESK
ncbi:ERAP1-like C-terminal domain-containing protein [Epithele typhae]|uniref:ERAP1-like C-terminal domain-containing protein n=1 Tax=Epithele typhae TaxID=378194 RepID=UPI002007EC03|nr:ERAP1-like C-terminal domain-containing protein [Epithele typhae]KAH9923974.1 ERAP1-like C-terminal domain-containing protein [Epithele typhae]